MLGTRAETRSMDGTSGSGAERGEGEGEMPFMARDAQIVEVASAHRVETVGRLRGRHLPHLRFRESSPRP